MCQHDTCGVNHYVDKTRRWVVYAERSRTGPLTTQPASRRSIDPFNFIKICLHCNRLFHVYPFLFLFLSSSEKKGHEEPLYLSVTSVPSVTCTNILLITAIHTIIVSTIIIALIIIIIINYFYCYYCYYYCYYYYYIIIILQIKKKRLQPGK